MSKGDEVIRVGDRYLINLPPFRFTISPKRLNRFVLLAIQALNLDPLDESSETISLSVLDQEAAQKSNAS